VYDKVGYLSTTKRRSVRFSPLIARSMIPWDDLHGSLAWPLYEASGDGDYLHRLADGSRPDGARLDEAVVLQRSDDGAGSGAGTRVGRDLQDIRVRLSEWRGARTVPSEAPLQQAKREEERQRQRRDDRLSLVPSRGRMQ
jgi:hypothetical protein